MAEEVNSDAPKPKGKKMLIIIIAVVLVLALAGGGAVVYLLTSKPAAEKGAEQGDEEHAKDDGEEHPPIYEPLPQFTTRLSDGETYLQCEVNLKVADPKVQEKIKLYLPEIKDSLLRLMSSKSAEEMNTQEGRDKLAEEIQTKVNEILEVKKASKGVQKVLFPAFIVQ